MFWITRGILRGAASAVNASGDPGPPKRTVVGPVAFTLSAGLCVFSVMYMLGNGLSSALLTFDILVIPVLMLAGVITTAVAHSQPRVTHLSKLTPPVPPHATTAELGDRIAILRQLPPEPATVNRPEYAPPVPGNQAPGGVSAPKAAPAASTAIAVRTRPVASLRQMREDNQGTVRLKRVAAILLADCPDCKAQPGDYCAYLPGIPVSLLDSGRSIVAHDRRIGHAVKLGLANIKDVVAQFADNVPDGVWEEAL